MISPDEVLGGGSFGGGSFGGGSFGVLLLLLLLLGSVGEEAFDTMGSSGAESFCRGSAAVDWTTDSLLAPLSVVDTDDMKAPKNIRHAASVKTRDATPKRKEAACLWSTTNIHTSHSWYKQQKLLESYQNCFDRVWNLMMRRGFDINANLKQILTTASSFWPCMKNTRLLAAIMKHKTYNIVPSIIPSNRLCNQIWIGFVASESSSVQICIPHKTAIKPAMRQMNNNMWSHHRTWNIHTYV